MKKDTILSLYVGAIVLLAIGGPILYSSPIQAERIDHHDKHADTIHNEPQIGKKISLAICHIKKEGLFNLTIKDVYLDDYTQMLHGLTDRLSSTHEYGSLFEEILGTFKENDLISNDVTLQDILDSDTVTGFNTTTYNLSVMEPFVAHFSPVLLIGMGFGAGIADTIGLFTGNVYSFGVIGLGGIFCIDAFAKTIYVQYTFTFPLLIHILSGFIGVMMFPVNLNFISSSLPIAIYSNFVAFGLSGVTVGIPVPS
ncbi:MAG: hypothetical protein V1769_00650 [Thermoplasmatota archaeon]